MRPRLILPVVLLLASLAAPGSAVAQPPQAQDGAQPLDRLLPQIRRSVPGQFLDAEGINRNGAPGYRLKWLTPEGRVIERDVDARTGRFMAPDRPGFGTRDPDGPALPPRSNFTVRNGEDGDTRFDGNLPQRGFGENRRFNRPPAGPGGFGNRGERFGGPGDGEGRRMGGGRARGRGDE